MPARTYRLTVLVLLALHALMLGALAAATPWTTDEPNYLQAGIALRKELRWDVLATVLHGPLTFYSNQLAAWLGASVDPWEGYKLLARVSMLPWALLCAGMVAHLARRAFGERAALGALLLHVLNPVVLAHGCLITSDMALAAATLVVVRAADAWLARPSARAAVALGAALGLALATKYLALLLVPALVLAALLVRPRGPKALLARAGGALLAGAAALLALHAAYLFRPGGYEVLPAQDDPDPASESSGPLSGTLRSACALPGVPLALRALPAPFVRGIDYQLFAGEAPGKTVLGDRIGAGFWAYYLVALGTKLPAGWLLLLLLGLVVREARAPPRGGFVLLATLCAAVPLLYLSLLAKLQLGIRYALPTVVLLAVPAGKALAFLLERPRARVLAWVALALCFAFLVRNWPRLLGSFNTFAGSRPYLLFVDSNLAWPAGMTGDDDEAELAARQSGAARVLPNGGPRLGRVLAWGGDLAPQDPRDPTRAYHWLRGHEPVDHVGAWYAFVITESVLRARAERDPRARVELATALLGAGRGGDALQALGDSGDADADRVRVAARERAEGREHAAAYGQAVLALGRADLATDARFQFPLRAQALLSERRYAELVALGEDLAKQRPLALVEEAIWVAQAYSSLGRPEAALVTLDAAAPDATSPIRPEFEARRKQLVRQMRAVRDLMARGSGRYVR